jgi:predicted O-methyltransferase YrrM
MKRTRAGPPSTTTRSRTCTPLADAPPPTRHSITPSRRRPPKASPISPCPHRRASTCSCKHGSADVNVVSVEADAHHAEVARANLEHAGVADRVDVRLGAGVDVLPQIKEEVEQGRLGRFQLVFIDADKENNWNYVDIAIGMCDPGACIIVDNVVRKGKLAEETDDPRVAGARRVVENVGRDERLDGVVVQTVGDKNYDGFLIAVVK